MKKFSVILVLNIFVLCSCSGGTKNNGGSNAQATPETPSAITTTTASVAAPTEEISQDVLQSAAKYDFLTSFDGCDYRRKMLMFAKAFFNSNENEVKKYLIEPNSKAVDFSYNDGRDYSNIEFILIKFDNIDTASNTAHAQLEYKWENTDMYYYMDITMKLVDGSWMVVNYSVEA